MRQRGMSVWCRIRFSACVLCLVVGIVLGLAPLSVFAGGSIHPALHAALFAPMVFVPLASLPGRNSGVSRRATMTVAADAAVAS